MEWTSEIAAFVEEHYSISQMWEEGVLDRWLLWAGSKHFLFLVHDENNSLVGLAIARPMSSAPKALDSPDDTHDPEGPIIYVDLAISPNNTVLKAICLGIFERWPNKPTVAFYRFGRSFDLKTYNFQKLRKTLLRK